MYIKIDSVEYIIYAQFKVFWSGLTVDIQRLPIRFSRWPICIAAIMYLTLPIFFLFLFFFMGRRECQLKKSRRGLHSILQLQMTLSGLRVTGEDDVSSPKYKAVNQSSNRHPWLALILSIGYRMRWFRTSYCLTSLVYVHNCLFVLGALS